MVGIIFFKWNIFYFVYLYWFENVIHIFFNLLKVNTTSHLVTSQNYPATRGQAMSALFGSMFANFVYFVFIIVGFGFMYPLGALEGEARTAYFVEMIKVFMFQNRLFNMAIWACILYKTIEYIRDFMVKRRYNAQNPFIAPAIFNKQEMVLHITILVGLGGMFMLQHPEFGGKIGLHKATWTHYFVAFVMIAVKLGFDAFELFKENKR
jgi:fumarate reductase subunit D